MTDDFPKAKGLSRANGQALFNSLANSSQSRLDMNPTSDCWSPVVSIQNTAAVKLPGARPLGIVDASLGCSPFNTPELLTSAREWVQMLPASDPRRGVIPEDIDQAQRRAAEPWASLILAQALVLLGAAGPVNHQHVQAALSVADGWHWVCSADEPRAGTFALEGLGLQSVGDASAAELLVLLADAYCDMLGVDDLFNEHLAIVAPAELARFTAWRSAAEDAGAAQ